MSVVSGEYDKKSKILPQPHGSSGGADLRFHSPQPDTSLRCQTTDTGLVYHAVCLFTFVIHHYWVTTHLTDTGGWLAELAMLVD